MSCFCKQQLNTILDALKSLPMSQIAALGSPGSSLSMSASMAANISAAISANAAASATAAASASISASAVARLEAVSQLHAALGGGVMGSASVGRMSVMIQSLNAVLEPMLQEINALMAPINGALMKLQQLASSLANIQSMTGLNLLMPNVSFVPPPLPTFAAMAAAAASMSATANANASASASANASLAASASASAAASAQASANAVMALRLQGAAMQLGFPLPGSIQGLNTAVGMLPALPAVSPVGAAMSVVQQTVASLMSVQSGLGVNPFAPNAMAMLQPILATISQNLSASLAGNATATANIAGTASANATATAQALASINSNAILNAAAQIPFPSIPDLQTAAASIGLGQNLGMLTGTIPLRTTPCAGCVVPGWK